MTPGILAAYDWAGTFVIFGIATLVLRVVAIVPFLRDSPSFLLARGKKVEAQQKLRKVSDENLDFHCFIDRGGFVDPAFWLKADDHAGRHYGSDLQHGSRQQPDDHYKRIPLLGRLTRYRFRYLHDPHWQHGEYAPLIGVTRHPLIGLEYC
jgi:hypothetical protein